MVFLVVAVGVFGSDYDEDLANMDLDWSYFLGRSQCHQKLLWLCHGVREGRSVRLFGGFCLTEQKTTTWEKETGMERGTRSEIRVKIHGIALFVSV